MLELVWLIPIVPLLGFVVLAVFGGRLSRRSVGIIGCASVGLSFLVSIAASWALLALDPESRQYSFELYRLISAEELNVAVGFLLDPLSMVMILIVSGVGFVIHLYSVGYMHADESIARYFSYLNLFVFFMLTLVLADNLVILFVGWEGVGLCSYLLIGFWYGQEENARAGKKAFIVTRVGDAGFIIGIFLCFALFGTVDYLPIFDGAHTVLAHGGLVVTALTLLLLFGALGKSAQVPLQVWLPDAMRGPTPVSALIHAATMVTAGVYMIARLNPLFTLAPVTMLTIAVIGMVTALYGASTALGQREIKKVLAFSTISQLGYMFMAVGAGAYSAGIFHLMTHAFFKALLFLGAGCVIHAFHGENDIFKMGGLKRTHPVTFWTFLAASLALAAFPGTSGFFSKDAILWAAVQSPMGPLLWTGGVVAAFLTSLYIFKLVFLVFFGQGPGGEHGLPRLMEFPLVVLAALALVGGYVNLPASMGGAHIFDNFLAPVFHSNAGHEGGGLALEVVLTVCSSLTGLAGILTAYLLYVRRRDIPERLERAWSRFYGLLSEGYYFDRAYEFLLVRPYNRLGELLWKGMDQGVIDGTIHRLARSFERGSLFAWRFLDKGAIDGFVDGLAGFVLFSSRTFSRLQRGFMREYAASMVLGIVIIIGYILVTRI